MKPNAHSSSIQATRSRQPRLARLQAGLGLATAACLLAGCQSLPPGHGVTSAGAAQAPAAVTEPAKARAGLPPYGDQPYSGQPYNGQPEIAALSPERTPVSAGNKLSINPELLQAQDLWGRMRRGYTMDVLTHELVQQHALQFAKSDFLAKRSDRIRLYMPLIIEELEARQMPLELAMLPLVESALNPHARSPVGATGFWQFMAPTAKRFQMRTSSLVDDRKNLRQSTRAGLDYLQTLHRQFGDWHLAMAAYNWGEGNVGKAVARQRERGGPANFNTLAATMPRETRNYVPQIMALARLVADPASFGAQLPASPDKNPLVEVSLPHDMDLVLLQSLSGMSQRELLELNPAIKPPLVLAKATPRLLMPQDAARRFEPAQARHSGPTASWSIVKLHSTEALVFLASKFGVSAREVAHVNAIPAGMKPVAGSTLLLPIAAPIGSSADDSSVANAFLNTTPDLVKVALKARAKESLKDVAARVGVGPNQLADWNDIKAKRIGQKLSTGRPLQAWLPREHAMTAQLLADAGTSRRAGVGVGVRKAESARSRAKSPATKRGVAAKRPASLA